MKSVSRSGITASIVPMAFLLAIPGRTQASPWCDANATMPTADSSISSTIWDSSNEQAAWAGLVTAHNADTTSPAPKGAFQLPADYTSLPPDIRVLTLINLERTSRGLAPFDSGNSQYHGNDPVIGLAAAHHSAFLANLNPPTTLWHDNGIEGDHNTRLNAIPGVANHMPGEIISGGLTPVAAVFLWMYRDGPAWLHRRAILGLNGISGTCYTNAGTGVAAGGTYGSFYTVDFATSTATSPYTSLIPPPPPPIPGAIPSIPSPELPLISSSGVALNSDGSIDLTFSTVADPYLQATGNIRHIQVYKNFKWGTHPTGALPLGSEAFKSCVPAQPQSTLSCEINPTSANEPLTFVVVDQLDRVQAFTIVP